MTEDRLTPLQIQAFARHLRLEEKSEATMEKYLRDIRAFARWLDGREISKGLERGVGRLIWWSGATPPPASMPCSPP